MRVPIENNSAYKKRLITAMLEERELHELSQANWTPSLSWSPKLILSVIGFALLSGIGMFSFLCHHDASKNAVAKGVTLTDGGTELASGRLAPVAASQPDVAVSKPVSSPAGSTTSSDPKVSGAVPQSVDFKLRRSRNFQTVGPLGLRLLRINAKRRHCDLTIQFSDHRVVQKRLQLNKPVQLRPIASDEPLQLSISVLGKDSVAGSISNLPASPNSEKQ
jgi:hypothetical protein